MHAMEKIIKIISDSFSVDPKAKESMKTKIIKILDEDLDLYPEAENKALVLGKIGEIILSEHALYRWFTRLMNNIPSFKKAEEEIWKVIEEEMIFTRISPDMKSFSDRGWPLGRSHTL
jgi:hypothetical protein